MCFLFVRSLVPMQWVGLSVHMTCASCGLVLQEMSAPSRANLTTIGSLEATQAPGVLNAQGMEFLGSWGNSQKSRLGTSSSADSPSAD